MNRPTTKQVKRQNVIKVPRQRYLSLGTSRIRQLQSWSFLRIMSAGLKNHIVKEYPIALKIYYRQGCF